MNEILTGHLLDLCRKSDRTGTWQYSAFLSPAEQEDLSRCPEASGFPFRFCGGFEEAERRILAAGNEEFSGPPDPPIRVVSVVPKSLRYAEDLTHRDFLGAVLGLGMERDLVGDILVRDRKALLFCLEPAAEWLVSSLSQVRRTPVSAALSGPDPAFLEARFRPVRINVSSERLDAVVAAFTGLSRGKAAALFSEEKVFVNGRAVADKGARLKPGDRFSVRGFGKAVYDGIEYETRKSRLWVSLRQYV